MAKASSLKTQPVDGSNLAPHTEESQGLLSGSNSDDEDIIVQPGELKTPSSHSRSSSPRSAISPSRDPNGPRTPRTSNRVRFDLTTDSNANGHAGAPPAYSDDDEELPRTAEGIPLAGRRDPNSQRRSIADDAGWESESDGSNTLLAHLMRPKSSLRSAMSNMANSIIGAGIIGQPYALRQAGFLTGVSLLIALTITVDWTIRLIVINSKLSGRDSFQGTVEYCFGQWGLVAISLAQWAFAFGGMVAFGVIVGDSIPHVLVAVWPGLPDIPVLGWLASRRVVVCVLIMGVSWPLSLYRDISKLAKASTLALISMLVILITVLTQGFGVPAESKGPMSLPLWTLNNGVFQAIGVISFAFVCHHNSLLIYGSLSTPTLDRFSLVTHVSTFISLIACLTMALSGFLTFGSLTQGNVLNNFPTDNTLVNVARFCFGLNMLTTLPLEAFVCREVMFHYWYDGDLLRVPTTVHFIVSTALVFSSMLISLMICDLGAVFELIGATSACALAYILPPLCYIKLSRDLTLKMRIAAYGTVAFGSAVLVISVVQAVMKIASSEPGTATCG